MTVGGNNFARRPQSTCRSCGSGATARQTSEKCVTVTVEGQDTGGGGGDQPPSNGGGDQPPSNGGGQTGGLDSRTALIGAALLGGGYIITRRD